MRKKNVFLGKDELTDPTPRMFLLTSSTIDVYRVYATRVS